jgi:DNA-binding transcriptional MerR regulator
MAAAYRSIGEVLAMLVEEFPDVTISKIRFLESQGLIAPERTSAGYRKFTDAEIERLRFVLREQRENYLPLRVIRDRLENDESESVLRPDDTSDPSMPRGLRVPSRSHPAARAADIDTTGSFVRPAARAAAATVSNPVSNTVSNTVSNPVSNPVFEPVSTTNPVARRLTRDDVQAQLGIDAALMAAIEASGIVKTMTMGDLVLYHPRDLDVLRAAVELINLGIEARHLKGWRLAAERELDVFEQLLSPKTRREAKHAAAQSLIDTLVDVGGRLRTGILRNRLHGHDE